MAAALQRGALSAVGAVEASLARIERLEPTLRAFVTVARQQALERAHALDRHQRQHGPVGPLHGVPVAIKDLTATAGIRTTQGSRRFAEAVPTENAACVQRLLDAGAIVVGKTNTPEFGFGAVCTNALQGPTANPWNPSLTSGGSSGGAAVAVTTGMVPLAHGTDFGGSVRTPASFCGCVGLRPTPGRIADPERALAWNGLATHGVLAGTVDDAALMLEVMAGPHPADPTSLGLAPIRPIDAESRRFRIAVSATLDGAFRIDPEVRTCFEEAVGALAAAFDRVEAAAPDVRGGEAAFKTLRAALGWQGNRALLAEGTDDLSPSFVWNVEAGREVGIDAFLAAERTRSLVFRRFQAFFQRFDLLVLPSASVLPFPNAQGEVETVGGVPCETIIDYLAPTFLVSLVGLPALSLPALVTADGRPFGLQLVAPPFAEGRLLQAARWLERQAGFRYRPPPELPAVAQA